MPVEVNVGGVWKDVTENKVQVAGTFKTVTQIEVNVGGVWKVVSLTAACTGGVSTLVTVTKTVSNPSNAYAGVQWRASDTTVYSMAATSDSWSSETEDWSGDCTADKFQGRWVQHSGDTPTSSTGSNGVWHDMDTTDVMVKFAAVDLFDVYNGNFTFSLRRKSDSVIVMSDTFDMHAEVDF